jgi:hypothetical protein
LNPATPSGSVAQSVEQRTFNPLVASSSLARPTKMCKASKVNYFWGLFSFTASCIGYVLIIRLNYLPNKESS